MGARGGAPEGAPAPGGRTSLARAVAASWCRGSEARDRPHIERPHRQARRWGLTVNRETMQTISLGYPMPGSELADEGYAPTRAD